MRAEERAFHEVKSEEKGSASDGAALLSTKFSHITKPEWLRKKLQCSVSVCVCVCRWDLLCLDPRSPQSKLTGPPTLSLSLSLSINYHLSRLSSIICLNFRRPHSLKMLIFRPPFFLMSYLSLGLCAGVCVCVCWESRGSVFTIQWKKSLSALSAFPLQTRGHLVPCARGIGPLTLQNWCLAHLPELKMGNRNIYFLSQFNFAPHKLLQ